MSESGMAVQVALRIRPLVETEIMRGCQLCLDVVPNEPQIQVRGTDRAFTYNFVFGPEDSQLCFYNSSIKELVSRLFKGYNVTILAYGQTGSGKTYSMGTSYTADEGEMGVIPRAISDVFNKMNELENWDFKVTVSFMELYKEQLYDLLATNKCVVDIREDGKGIRIPGLTEVPVTCAEDTINCLIQGSTCRATGATAMNAQSSRSHAIFTVTLHQQKRDDVNTSTTAKFHLVDLAGSERSKKTKATGERFKEGVNINRGLLALGNVISALGDEGQKGFISYRDSKLTRLLQDSLGGNSITLMIACVSPADYNLEETLSTLRYADRARRIKNKPIVNQDPRVAEITRLKQQNQELQLELLARASGGGCPPEHQRLEEDNSNLISKNRTLAEELNNAVSASTNLFERALMAEVARDRMKVKLCELQAEYGQAMDSLSQTLEQENCPANLLEQLKHLRDLQLKIQELQAEQKRSSDEILNHELSSGMSPKQTAVQQQNEDDSYDNLVHVHEDIDERHQTHTLQQVERTKELQELNQKLALKEELAAKLIANMNHMSNFNTNYETNVTDLQQQIASLQKEKEELMNVLQNVQNVQNINTSKISEQRRKRLQELEQKISALNKRITEQGKIIKMKEKNDEKINLLNSEIQGMKHTKVKLIRQMRSENERFRTWKQEREKELLKLRVQDRRRQNEMARMERLHTKQQNVLKRKVEEAVAVNKRLKDALALQKSVQERRAQHHGTTAKVQLWIDQELEVLISTVDAERTLEQLLEDRAMLHAQMQDLQAQTEQNDTSPEDKACLESEIKQLKEDIDLRNVQIADLQQKILDSDQENKAKTRWDTVQSMAEAKCALKHLFELTAEIKREVSNKEFKYEDLEAAHQKLIAKLSQTEQQLKENMQSHQQTIDCLEKEHQEKVLLLLRQLKGSENNSGDSQLVERLQIQSEELEKMEILQNELEQKTKEIESLKLQLQTSDNKTRETENIEDLQQHADNPHKMPSHKTKSSNHTQNYKRNSFEFIECLLSEDDDVDDNVDLDPDWQKTPIFKKLQKLKTDRYSVHPEQERAVKRTSDGQIKCTCKGACKNRLCGCRKGGTKCNKDCKCDNSTCQNRDQTARVLFSNSSGDSTSDENKDPDEESFKRPRAMPSKEDGFNNTIRIMKKPMKYFNNGSP